jgi:hypothetical protein
MHAAFNNNLYGVFPTVLTGIGAGLASIYNTPLIHKISWAAGIALAALPLISAAQPVPVSRADIQSTGIDLAYFDRAIKCIGDADPVCRYIVKYAFPILLDKDILLGTFFAEECIDKNDPFCKAFVRKTIPELLEKNSSLAGYTVNKCIGKEDPDCQSIVKLALPLLLEKDIETAAHIAAECIRQDDQYCKSAVRQSLPALVNKNPLSAELIVFNCLGKEDPICQSIGQQGIRALIDQGRAGLASICLDKQDLTCKTVVVSAFKALLDNHYVKFQLKEMLLNNYKMDAALNLAGRCISQNLPCRSFVEELFFQQLHEDFFTANAFAHSCANSDYGDLNEDKKIACQTLFLNNYNYIPTSFHAGDLVPYIYIFLINFLQMQRRIQIAG